MPPPRPLVAAALVLGCVVAAAAMYMYVNLSTVRTMPPMSLVPLFPARQMRASLLRDTPHLRGMPHLRVATYNACLLPFPVAHDGSRRVAGMATALPVLFADVDVLVLCELISGKRSRRLLRALAATWPYQSKTSTALGRVNGGVRIVSKHPIRRQVVCVYSATELSSSDCLAAKGVVGAELHVPGAPGSSVYVFGTHMHAPDTASGQAVRRAQASELHRAVSDMAIRADRVVLLAGDFNMDMRDAAALRVLRAAPAAWVRGASDYTIDEATNALVGIDGSCRRGDGSCVPRVIDGVYAAVGYGRTAVTATVVAVRDRRGVDLSDHHAVDTVVTWS